MMRKKTILTCLLFMLAIICAPAAHAGRLEAGTFTTTSTFGSNAVTAVNFQQTFDTIPVVVALSDQRGGDAASIRITNISTTGFSALILEPDGFDGPHVSQTVQYIAIETGRHVLPGGTTIEAGRDIISAVQSGSGVAGAPSFQIVNFTQPISGQVSVIHQIQTANSETRNVPSQSSQPHITSISVNASSTGFSIALDRSQSQLGTVRAETVGWIAFPAGSSDSFSDITGNNVTWGATNSAATIRGWDDGCFTVSLPITSSSAVVVAKKRTRNNGDGGWLRSCSQNSTSIGLANDEDRAQDTERGVPIGLEESAAIMAFSRPFHANLRAEIEVTKVSATISGTSLNGFSLPGAIREYIVTVRNVGNAPVNYGTLIINDTLSPNTDLLVTDIQGSGSGPVAIAEVNGTALLNFSFTDLAATDDSLFFLDSGNTLVTPIADANGADDNVAILRIQPSGTLEGNRGTGPGEFNLRYRARIK
ncbi:hypothetical protein ACR9YC_04220 [Parasphingorhabdus sp. DH2-15]|uniref:hypothetical protein n=1 Tax=Parasphingorhabdus sp. DH2-15 TaxID=3444112 RepID=UPI003F686D71